MGSKVGTASDFGRSGWSLKCHGCGAELPLLHPHIIIERTNEDGELICEQCYQMTQNGDSN